MDGRKRGRTGTNKGSTRSGASSVPKSSENTRPRSPRNYHFSDPESRPVMQADKSALDKLEELLSRQRDFFNDDEIAALKRVAARERAWMAIGMLAGGMRTVLTYIGFFIGAWMAFKAGLIDWLGGLLK